MIKPLIEVFAVEETAVQVTWRGLPGADVQLQAGPTTITATASEPAWFRREGRSPLPIGPAARSAAWGDLVARSAARGGPIAQSAVRGGPIAQSAVRGGPIAQSAARGGPVARLNPWDGPAARSNPWGGPGAATISGLHPGTKYDLTAQGERFPRRRVATFTTLHPPPGRLLAKFATISDMHIGERGFGTRQKIEDVYPLPEGWDAYPLRCARAAIAEAVAWGAELLVVKGDLTRKAEPIEFEEVGQLLADAPIPVEATFGNHEYQDRTDGRAILARYGIVVPDRPWSRDLPGLRIVLGDSARFGHNSGRLDPEHERELVSLVGEAAGGSMVVLHHQLQPTRLPHHYPPGILGPEASRLLDALAAVNPATILVAGHTHRNRRHQYGPVVVVEVGSTHHYPGQWAGYAVYEGGIRQVIRRVAAPEAISWTEGTFWSLGGVWGLWAPGSLRQRCFSHAWPRRRDHH